eukprot:scaffold4998_cov72-Phaeocystis_antarctica.AAC.6
MGSPACCPEEALLPERPVTAPNRLVEAGLQCVHERACVFRSVFSRAPSQPVAVVLVRRNMVGGHGPP